jgi:hypothetical protein
MACNTSLFKAAEKPHSTQACQHKKGSHARKDEILGYGYRPSAKSARKHLKTAQIVKTDLDTSKLPVASGARTAPNNPAPQNPSEVLEIKRLMQLGFQYIPCGESPMRFVFLMFSQLYHQSKC